MKWVDTMKKKLNKKVIIPVILLLIVIGIVMGVIGYKKYYKSKELLLVMDKKMVVSLGDKVYNTDAVKKIVNGKVVDKKEVINTDKIGIKKIFVTIEDYFKEKKKYSYEIEVKDSENPRIEFKEKLSTTEGTKIDLLKDVKVSDNYDKNLEVKVEGDYDFDKPGEYELFYVAKDSSGNEAKEKFILLVEKKVVVVEKKEEPKKEEQKKEENNSTTTTPTTPVPAQNADGTFTTSKGFHGETRNGITYIDGILIANKTYSLPSSYAPGGLTGETSSAFNNMKNAAAAEGISIWVASGFRSYDLQNRLWTKRKNNNGIAFADAGTARPGHSEHQTGLAMDINMVDDAFENTAAGQWLFKNAYKYGFVLRYPRGKTGETGYKYESWHYRYVGVDLATKLFNGGDWITLENYFGITSEYNY